MRFLRWLAEPFILLFQFGVAIFALGVMAYTFWQLERNQHKIRRMSFVMGSLLGEIERQQLLKEAAERDARE